MVCAIGCEKRRKIMKRIDVFERKDSRKRIKRKETYSVLSQFKYRDES